MPTSTNPGIESILSFPPKSHSYENIAIVIHYDQGPVKLINLKLDGKTNGVGSVYLYSKEQIRESQNLRDSDLQSKIKSCLNEKKDLIVINLKPDVAYLDVDGESQLVADVIANYLEANYLETRKKYPETQEVVGRESSQLIEFHYPLSEESLALFYRFLPLNLRDEGDNEGFFGFVVMPRE